MPNVEELKECKVVLFRFNEGWQTHGWKKTVQEKHFTGKYSLAIAENDAYLKLNVTFIVFGLSCRGTVCTFWQLMADFFGLFQYVAQSPNNSNAGVLNLPPYCMSWVRVPNPFTTVDWLTLGKTAMDRGGVASETFLPLDRLEDQIL